MQIGVIIGRFQVPELHDGHVRLIEHVKKTHGQVLILLGVSPVLGSKRSPLDYATRQKMIQDKFPEALIQPLPDMPTDESWSKNLDTTVRTISPLAEVTLYGGKDSFIPFYKGKFNAVEIELELSPSGTDVRAVTANRVKVSSDFRAGVIYGIINQYQRVFPTVDVAILRKVDPDKIKRETSRYQVLLGKKSNLSGWWFPGGFVSPEDESSETAARREALEETGIKCPTLEYVCSNRQSDWRYRHIDDGVIVTTLFACLDSVGAPKAGDDLDHVKFFPLDEEVVDIGETHKPLFKKLAEVYGQIALPKKGWSQH